MADQQFPEILNEEHEVYSALAGVMHAVQTLATVLLDDEAKRAQVTRLLEPLSEVVLRSNLSDDRKQKYLEGLGSVGAAAAVSKAWHQPPG